MKLSELIARLAEMLEEHGDVPVVIVADASDHPPSRIRFICDGVEIE